MAIIETLRNNILKEIAQVVEFDHWDEGTAGVAWLNNELELFDSLYHLLYPRYQPRDWSQYSTVAEVQVALDECTPSYLRELYKFAYFGGSTEAEFRHVRRTNCTTFTQHFFANLQVP